MHKYTLLQEHSSNYAYPLAQYFSQLHSITVQHTTRHHTFLFDMLRVVLGVLTAWRTPSWWCFSALLAGVTAAADGSCGRARSLALNTIIVSIIIDMTPCKM
jgi:hypothetical protein